MKKSLFILFLIFTVTKTFAQTEVDSIKLEQIRRESGVDPTRVQTRLGYSIMVFDQESYLAQLNNRFSLNLGVNRWSINMKYDVVTKSPIAPGEGFTTGSGDIRFTVLNAFYVEGKHALAGSAEFSIPTGKQGFGSQYFSVTPSITYSYTIQPSLFFAVQPQYSFQLLKDPIYPDLKVITVRAFLAKFTKAGYFFVFEPRPVFDLVNDKFDLILSPIMGKAIGGGYNLILLTEIPTTDSTIKTRGILYQFGFNKNF
ncbi:hypothetical protein EF405_19710 [Cyclobacteriaceae bacterium YHN15]|nr:hypothetical protein EF405_19710 [Cyclobacteriaceae bacterium YHN15]